MFSLPNFDRKWKFRYIKLLVVTYSLSILLLLIGFFTPGWLTGRDEYYRPYWYFNFIYLHHCNTAGIISGTCRFPYRQDTDGDLGFVLKCIFWMMLTALIVVFMSVVMVTVTFAKRLEDNSVVMAFLGVLFGVLYPIASVLVIASGIMVELNFSSDVGYSTIISQIAGGLMLLFYVGLRVYDILVATSRSNGQDKPASRQDNTTQK